MTALGAKVLRMGGKSTHAPSFCTWLLLTTLYLLVTGSLTPYSKLAQEFLLILTFYFSSELVADPALNKQPFLCDDQIL